MRSAPHGGSAPQLALPARSPYRRLRASTRAVARLNPRRAKASLLREGKPREGGSADGVGRAATLREREGSAPIRREAAPSETPAALGNRMPAEWEPHEA